MNAPEKIYISKYGNGKLAQTWRGIPRPKGDSVAYIRADLVTQTAPTVNGREINIPEFSKALAYLMHMKLAEACLDGDVEVQKTMPEWMERQVRIVLGLECWDKCKAHNHVYITKSDEAE